MLIASNQILSQITYVDNFDIVYPYGNSTSFLDINGDGINDISVKQEGSVPAGSFGGLTNTIGANRIQGTTLTGYSGMYTVDCTNIVPMIPLTLLPLFGIIQFIYGNNPCLI
jgi:hypothetical protein